MYQVVVERSAEKDLKRLRRSENSAADSTVIASTAVSSSGITALSPTTAAERSVARSGSDDRQRLVLRSARVLPHPGMPVGHSCPPFGRRGGAAITMGLIAVVGETATKSLPRV